MQYQTTINDEVVFGITAAREAYNATLPAEVVITPASEGVNGEEGQEEVKGPNPAILNNDALYLDFVLTNAVASWCRQYTPVAAPPETPPVVINGVPQTVTKKQAKKALAAAGLLSAVETALANATGTEGAFARIEWADSITFNRNNAVLLSLAGALGMSDAQLDALFVAAATMT